MKKKKSVISEKGQITIPKSLRDRFGLRAGATLVFLEQDGKLVLQKESEESPFDRWAGAGKLPVGRNVDEYLDIVRGDDYSN